MADFNWGLQTIGAGFYALAAPGNSVQGQDIGPIGSDKFLKSLSIWFPIGGSPAIANPRAAVYQGGILDDPMGATLLWDFGILPLVIGPAYSHIETIPQGARPAIAQNVITWIVLKDQFQSQVFSSELTPASWEDFVGAAGNRDTVGISSDQNLPFEATIPGVGALHGPVQIVNMYITYTDEGPNPEFFPRMFRSFALKIPEIYKRIQQDSYDALVEKADEHIIDWENDVVEIGWLLDPARAPSKLLEVLGNFVNAGILPDDDDRQKRQKIQGAVESHKRRGSFVFDAKPKIDAIAGGDSKIFEITGSDEWIIVGDGLTPPAFYWAALGVDNIDLDLGITISGQEPNDLTLAGNIAIDVDNSTLTFDEVEQIKLELRDVAPAYYRVLLGYVVSGAFIVYPNGIIE